MHAELSLTLICIPCTADDDNKLSDELTSERLNSSLQRRVVYYLHVLRAAIVESSFGWYGAEASCKADWLNRIDKPMWSALFQEGACMREQLFEGERV